jgi:hypothetical protein
VEKPLGTPDLAGAVEQMRVTRKAFQALVAPPGAAWLINRREQLCRLITVECDIERVDADQHQRLLALTTYY